MFSCVIKKVLYEKQPDDWAVIAKVCAKGVLRTRKFKLYIPRLLRGLRI